MASAMRSLTLTTAPTTVVLPVIFQAIGQPLTGCGTYRWAETDASEIGVWPRGAVLRHVVGGWTMSGFWGSIRDGDTPSQPREPTPRAGGLHEPPDRIGSGKLENPTKDMAFNYDDFEVVPVTSAAWALRDGTFLRLPECKDGDRYL